MITGKLNGVSRAEAKSLIEENSGTTVSSISKKLNYLIIGEKPTKRKIEIAKELKVPKFSSLKKIDLVYQILDLQAANPTIVAPELALRSLIWIDCSCISFNSTKK